MNSKKTLAAASCNFNKYYIFLLFLSFDSIIIFNLIYYLFLNLTSSGVGPVLLIFILSGCAGIRFCGNNESPSTGCKPWDPATISGAASR